MSPVGAIAASRPHDLFFMSTSSMHGAAVGYIAGPSWSGNYIAGPSWSGNYKAGPSWSGRSDTAGSAAQARMARLGKSCMYASILALLAGCTQGASRIQPVEIDSSSASSEAMELYDTDGDSAIAGDELNAVPGIKKHLDRYDADGDQRVTRDEIRERLRSWSQSRVAIMGATFTIYLDGRPLEGATVSLVPEPYLEPNVKPASGVTSPIGLTRVSHSEADLPKTANGRAMYGVKSGTYKVQITHPNRNILAKYNTATELGAEISHDVNPAGEPIRIDLTSA